MPGYSLQSEKQLLHLACLSPKNSTKTVKPLWNLLCLWNAALVHTPGNTEGCLLCESRARKGSAAGPAHGMSSLDSLAITSSRRFGVGGVLSGKRSSVSFTESPNRKNTVQTLDSEGRSCHLQKTPALRNSYRYCILVKMKMLHPKLSLSRARECR